jgi:hypothetical protein
MKKAAGVIFLLSAIATAMAVLDVIYRLDEALGRLELVNLTLSHPED